MNTDDNTIDGMTKLKLVLGVIVLAITLLCLMFWRIGCLSKLIFGLEASIGGIVLSFTSGLMNAPKGIVWICGGAKEEETIDNVEKTERWIHNFVVLEGCIIAIVGVLIAIEWPH